MQGVPARRQIMPRGRIDLRRAFVSDLPLKLTAVLVAMIFWAVPLLN